MLDGGDVRRDVAGPYCGCRDCEVREALAAAFVVMLEAAPKHALSGNDAIVALASP